MTKNKTRKMTKSTFAIIIMGIAMVAMLAFGGTFAYFTATTTAVNGSATTGTIKLGANSVGTFVTNVVSSEEILSNSSVVKVVNESNRESYIFITFTVELLDSEGGPINGVNLVDVSGAATDAAAEALLTHDKDYGLKYAMYSEQNGVNWTTLTGVRSSDPQHGAVTGVYYYAAPAIASANTPEDITVCNSIKFYGNSNSTTASAGDLMGAQIKLTITSKAIQQSGFSSAAEAYVAVTGSDVELVPAQEP